jgi:single-strand DNA-binding protein
MNRVCIIGRLTRDPELRHTGAGKSVASFSVAVQKRIKPQDGSPDADFFNVVAWNNSADYVANYLTKGRLVSVDGRLQSRKYTASDGTDRNVVEIVADNVSGLDRPRDDQAVPYGPTSTESTIGDGNEYDPFADE